MNIGCGAVILLWLVFLFPVLIPIFILCACFYIFHLFKIKKTKDAIYWLILVIFISAILIGIATKMAKYRMEDDASYYPLKKQEQNIQTEEKNQDLLPINQTPEVEEQPNVTGDNYLPK